MAKDELLRKLQAVGAILEGHFRLTSGRHSSRFFLLARAFQYPPLAEELGRGVARLFSGLQVEAVVGPAVGGILLAHEVARALGARSIFTEKDGEGKMTLRRGFQLHPGERILLVEDAVTTGGSLLQAYEALRPWEPQVVGIGAVVDRGSSQRVELPMPVKALLELPTPDWAPEECPLCREGIPLREPKKEL
ncbi:MAG: orotate phosphoribosyltransferase [Clostridiales bacterium]|nr:orotate phosphoribosyltransferase [Clostridiales bacterium]